MKFLDIMANLSGIWIVIWVALNYYILNVETVSSESLMWLGVLVIVGGFSVYLFKLLNRGNLWDRARRLPMFFWLCVFLPLLGNCLFRFLFETKGIDSSELFQKNISDLANTSIVAVFCLLLIHWRLFFVRPFWRTGFAVGILMFCIGFLGHYHETNEAIMIQLTQNIGKSSAVIEKLVGKPIAMAGSLHLKGLPAEAAACDENWLYEFNYKYVLVSFRDGKCVSAKVCDPAAYFECRNENLNRAITLAKGKTRESVIELLGRPTNMQILKIPNWSEDRSHDNLTTRQAIVEAINRPTPQILKVASWSEDETWQYDGTEFGTGFSLKFQNGVCTEAECNQIYQ